MNKPILRQKIWHQAIMGQNMILKRMRVFMRRNFDLVTLKHLLLISKTSSLLALIDGGGAFFIPLIIGSYLVYQFYESRQRVKYITFLIPFIFLVVFFSGGGLFTLKLYGESMFGNSRDWIKILVGVWCAYFVLILMWFFFKGKLRWIQFIMLTIIIPIPYLVGLNAMQERADIFLFYLLWNSGLSFALSNYFLPITPNSTELHKSA